MPDTEALVTEHLALCEREARRWTHAPFEQEDLVGDAAVGLVKAAQRYDPRRGVPFSAFALLYIRGAILETVRKRARKQSLGNGTYAVTLSMEALAAEAPETRDIRIDVVDASASVEHRAEQLAKLRLVKDIPWRERVALVRTEVDGASAEEVGRELGVSVDRVYLLTFMGHRRLRRRAA